jgi:hypothetical protein
MSTTLTDFFRSPLLSAQYCEADDPDNLAALPQVSLNFLRNVVTDLRVSRVFEFGSGRSTQAFLDVGAQVTSLEDNSQWFTDTLKKISAPLKLMHIGIVQPLKICWRDGAPYRTWEITPQIREALCAAELILIDSPFFVPYRIETLKQVLSLDTQAVIVIDDTRIPTMERACAKIAKANPALHYASIQVGHGFTLFARHQQQSVKFPASLSDSLKAWRRFLKESSFNWN